MKGANQVKISKYAAALAVLGRRCKGDFMLKLVTNLRN